MGGRSNRGAPTREGSRVLVDFYWSEVEQWRVQGQPMRVKQGSTYIRNRSSRGQLTREGSHTGVDLNEGEGGFKHVSTYV